MSKTLKPQSKLDDNLKIHEYLAIRLRETGLSLRSAAKTIGISSAYLSDIATGKRIPEAGVCNAIADAFGDPRIKILRYAGWLNDDDISVTLAELERMAKKDPQFLELVKLYRNLDGKDEKATLLRIIKAALSK